MAASWTRAPENEPEVYLDISTNSIENVPGIIHRYINYYFAYSLFIQLFNSIIELNLFCFWENRCATKWNRFLGVMLYILGILVLVLFLLKNFRGMRFLQKNHSPTHITNELRSHIFRMTFVPNRSTFTLRFRLIFVPLAQLCESTRY